MNKRFKFIQNTLWNNHTGIVAHASQIYDDNTGKSVSQIIEDIGSSSNVTLDGSQGYKGDTSGKNSTSTGKYGHVSPDVDCATHIGRGGYAEGVGSVVINSIMNKFTILNKESNRIFVVDNSKKYFNSYNDAAALLGRYMITGINEPVLGVIENVIFDKGVVKIILDRDVVKDIAPNTVIALATGHVKSQYAITIGGSEWGSTTTGRTMILGYLSSSSGMNNIFGPYNTISRTCHNTFIVGDSNIHDGSGANRSIIVGRQNHSGWIGSLIFGESIHVAGEESIGIGKNNLVKGQYAQVIGNSYYNYNNECTLTKENDVYKLTWRDVRLEHLLLQMINNNTFNVMYYSYINCINIAINTSTITNKNTWRTDRFISFTKFTNDFFIANGSTIKLYLYDNYNDGSFSKVLGGNNFNKGTYNHIFGSNNTVTHNNNYIAGVGISSTQHNSTIIGKFPEYTTGSFIVGAGINDENRKTIMYFDNNGLHVNDSSQYDNFISINELYSTINNINNNKSNDWFNGNNKIIGIKANTFIIEDVLYEIKTFADTVLRDTNIEAYTGNKEFNVEMTNLDLCSLIGTDISVQTLYNVLQTNILDIRYKFMGSIKYMSGGREEISIQHKTDKVYVENHEGLEYKFRYNPDMMGAQIPQFQVPNDKYVEITVCCKTDNNYNVKANEKTKFMTISFQVLPKELLWNK